MLTFHFYVKEETVVHLDINSPIFLIEKEQLVAQGFERVGDVIRANNSAEAFEKFKHIHLDELGQFSGAHIVASLIGSLTSSG
ncbi:hypothetical protein [Moritella sp. F3]|uniref:hypothetical protein n=1 Tax=Moritella sp. F3 TaxID=2718882 RepID=UPI0018E12A01|nr:hypothetical protein [Moritella sp. F3]GIC75766.1 hypothetical protein FMO001_04930 [Moritella sp. F1]GIC81786.1 hypothetical protein FMO003_20670 [Moritella sp. F3]